MNTIKQPKDQSTKEKILKMLQNNAEEPEDIEDGTGTFTTFRTEYLINDISDLLASSQRELLENIEKWINDFAYMEDTPANRKLFPEDTWYPNYKTLHGRISKDPLRTVVTYVGLDQLRKLFKSQLSGEEKSK